MHPMRVMMIANALMDNAATDTSLGVKTIDSAALIPFMPSELTTRTNILAAFQ